ncbi:hypothetical protein Pint_19252 [Pistacia integerrima]|uniref:Uncharacterized protein n=1 Tax=Pistacia integerrima TaxID=434235 RepID=A0ACC0YXK0_9ROSI|nr:hypothetical protein Pint_19252 [Pistacia integerrima]
MDMFKMIWFLTIFVSIVSVEVAGRPAVTGSEEDEELEKQLKLLNKPASKTIKTEHGDIIDCVDVYKQPSLDHPALKNHTIQMEPSAFPEELRGQGTPLSSSNLMEVKPRRLTCPRGTVPIPRIQKEDLIRIRSLPKTTEANTYNPSDNDIHVTHVNPNLYGDNKTRLYTRWTVDRDDQTGCYNTLCPGFIQVGSVPLNQVLNQPTHGDLQRIAWGGFAYSPGNEAALEMGSGQFKSNDQENTCFAGGLQVIDEFNLYRDLSKFKIDTYSDKPGCYGVDYRGNTTGEIGYNVLFGGPGGLKCGN